MLTPEQKTKIIEKFRADEKDTGSSEVQIGLLSAEIDRLLLHLKKQKKDVDSKRGLLRMVAKRRTLLNFLKKENTRKYNSIIKKIGLKK